MPTELYDRVYGCLLGLAIGDALGVPVETMTREEIMAATNGMGITGFIPPMQTRVKDTAGLKAGSTSDDTQLTLVTLRSLVKQNGFNLRDQAMELVNEYERNTFGWGGTTRIAARDLMDWRDSGGKLGRVPELHAPEIPNTPGTKKRGCGSGVAMRIAPLALLHLFRPDGWPHTERFRADTMALGMLTHGDPRASIAAMAVGYAMYSVQAEERAGANDGPQRRIKEFILHHVTDAERTYRFFRPATLAFSDVLMSAFALSEDPTLLHREINTGFSAMQSVPFAIATALRHPDNFRAGVLEGVNAGQDTDTVGSMIGAILGARLGIKGIPEQWIMGLDGAGAISHYAGQLTDLIKRR